MVPMNCVTEGGLDASLDKLACTSSLGFDISPLTQQQDSSRSESDAERFDSYQLKKVQGFL